MTTPSHTHTPPVQVTGWAAHGPAHPDPTRFALHLAVRPDVDREAVYARLVEAVRDLAAELGPPDPPPSASSVDLAALGGLPPDVPPSWSPGIEAELAVPAPPDPPTGPVTSVELWRARWYVVPDDEVGGWALATASRPTSRVEEHGSRDRVLAYVIWEEHARWLARSHNLTLGYEEEP